jgi:hypothetical protein
MAQLTGEKRKGDVKLKMKSGVLHVECTYHYKILSSPTETRLDILYTNGLPIPYQTLEPEGLGVCIAVDATREENSAYAWDVTATFSSDVEDSSGQNYTGTGDQPDQWIPVREMFLEPYHEVTIKDINGKPYTNGAQTPFAQGPQIHKDNIRYDFWQFEPASTHDSVIAARNNTINEVPYMGQEKHTLKLSIRRSVVGIYYGRSLRLVEYSITYNEDNWHDKLANYGQSFMYLGKRYPYRYETEKTVVVNGPLGRKDYAFDEDYDVSAGEPTGRGNTAFGDRVVAGKDPDTGEDTFFAVEAPEPTLYFVERQIYRELDFDTFLRFPNKGNP